MSGPEELREMADELEKQQEIASEMVVILRRITTAGYCGAEACAKLMPEEFWTAMREGQELLDRMEAEGYSEVPT